jgi:hypothetical protein
MQRPNTVGREIMMETADGWTDSPMVRTQLGVRSRCRRRTGGGIVPRPSPSPFSGEGDGATCGGPYMCDSMRLTDFRSVASRLLYDLVDIVFANICWIETGSMSTIQREMAVARIAIS